MRLGLLVQMLLIFGSGCQSNDPYVFNNPEEWQVARDLAQCEWKVRCGELGVSEKFDCQAAARVYLQRYPSPYSLEDAARIGRADLNFTKAQECVKAWLTGGCTPDQKKYAITSCARYSVLSGRQQQGTVCQSNTDCISGYCMARGKPIPAIGCNGNCTPWLVTRSQCDPKESLCQDVDFCHPDLKTCEPRREPGQLCRFDSYCKDGLLCQISSMGTPQEPGQCALRGKVGDSCDRYKLADEIEKECQDFPYCDDLRQTTCELGLYCDLESRKCMKRLPAGSQCRQRASCADGLSCLGLKGDMTQLLQPGWCVLYSDWGQACGIKVAMKCPLWLDCDPQREQCLYVGVIGAKCGKPENFPCRPELYCDGVAQHCMPTKPYQSTCSVQTFADPCEFGACNPQTNTCELQCG